MMGKTRKSKNKTVSEKVAEIILSPHGKSSDEYDENENSAPKLSEYDEDFYELPADPRTSDFRKRNAELLSDQSIRYRGKVASRKDFQYQENEDDRIASEENDSEDASATSSTENEHSAQSEEGLKHNLSKRESSSEHDEENDNDDNDDANSDAIVEYEDNIGKAPHIFTENNKENEVQKGVCVQNQLNIWEKLLELRIHSQNLLSKSNMLPASSIIQHEQKENEAFLNSSNECKLSLAELLDQLLELQHTLYMQFSEIKTSLRGGHKRTLPHNTTQAPPIKRFAKDLDENFSKFKHYRNAVLLKWDDRTKLLTPGAGLKRKSLNQDYDVIQKINNALQNRISMIEKSQIFKYGKNNELNDTESGISRRRDVYDDTDFYHQQLRELIEYKANSSTNVSVITKQLVELQKLRQSMKKQVDTRASKGRKIRYVVHKKLINFMAPNDESEWTEESQNELYKSLFGS